MRQKQALSVMMSGANVFLTGAPGAGKTYVLNEFVKLATQAGRRVAVTASTGIAATHIGGNTIHSWSGLGIRNHLNDEDRRWLADDTRLIKRYNGVDVLVIDEVSMLHGRRLDMVNETAKLLRQNSAAFGGLQVILVGDMFQLPPISRANEDLDFVHESLAWQELEPKICYLTEQHRQQGDDGLLGLLEAMRSGDFDEMHGELIQDRLGSKSPSDESVTKLYSHNVDVEAINQRHLESLPNKAEVFDMQTKGSKARVEQLVKSVLAPEELILKVDAEVMFVANNFAEGFANGSRGRVIGFEDYAPIIRLTNGREITVQPHSWSLSEDGQVRAEVAQLPLRLAWAITIHKSQGMSLDAAEVDLSRAFTPGMGYVALSRIRSMEGLYLKGINRIALSMHPQIFVLDRELRRVSNDLAEQTEDLVDQPLPSDSRTSSPSVDEILFNKLKAWRHERSLKDKMPPFMIAHNKALSSVASAAPTTERQLLSVSGFGSRKVEAYGSEILSIVKNHNTSSKAKG